MPTDCPSTERLTAALRGRSTSPDDAELAAHLAECGVCQARLEEMAGGSGWLKGRVKAHETRPPESSSLRQAIQTLEAGSTSAEAGAAAPPPLDFLQPSDQPGVLGRFGPYEVVATVAIGGMGIVLKARDPALNRIVALKILPPTLAANSLARARFIREARAAAAVVHEHVVPIYAVDEFAGLPYLVMQFVQGRTLAERIKVSGPLTVEEILRIGAQTAAGLAAAHAQGLIHRDVKPGNILLENGVERVKITDFGLARAMDDSSLTREGYIAGTPEYMSPEQARNEPVDQRADLFSLGCVLYEMATGISPFRADKPLVAMRRVCDEEPRLAHKHNPRLPEPLSQLIHRLMAKSPASRPRTAADVADDLARLLVQSQQGVAASRWRLESVVTSAHRSTWFLRSAWALAVVLLLAVASFLIFRPRAKSPGAGEPPPAAASSAPFVIPASATSPERGFSRLGEAIDAAQDGSVIEFRFNGPRPVGPVRRNTKALILRAAPGFEPVLIPADRSGPFLFTRGPLAMEGLTLVTTPVSIPNAGRVARTSVGLSVENAPFLAAHCRFEISPEADVTLPRQPHSVRLLNSPSAILLRCRIISRTGNGLQWDGRQSSATPGADNHLRIEDCVVEGSLATIWRQDADAKFLSLRRNTVVGDSLFLMIGSSAAQPVVVTARENVFALVRLLKRPAPDQAEATLSDLLRWDGAANVFWVQTYAESSLVVNDHSEWLANRAVSETNSLSQPLDISTRLARLTGRTAADEAAAFSLTAEERQRLKAQGWTSSEPPGADPRKTGPGQPYHDWRNSPAYAEWLKLVREHIPRSAADP